MKRRPLEYQKNSIVATAILFVAVALLSVLFVNLTMHHAKQECYGRLVGTTGQIVHELEYNMRNNRAMLRMLAEILAEEEDLTAEKARKILSIYETNSAACHIGIVMPEGNVTTVDNGGFETACYIDYPTECEKGEHVSGLQIDLYDHSALVIRSYEPIFKDGETIGLLFGEVRPSSVTKLWLSDYYEGKGTLEIVDRENGCVVISTDQKEGRNFFTLGYSPVQGQKNLKNLETSICNEESGFAEYELEELGERGFISYQPMSICHWSVVLSVPGEDVLETALLTEKNLMVYLLSMAFLFLLYFIWIYTTTRRSLARAEKLASLDTLTGALNRNSYEQMVKQSETAPAGMSCIYVDINGLHELNNAQGHLAGDQMLQYVADSLRGNFGTDNVYRIGGDEFIIFCVDRDKNELIRELKEIKETLEKHDYHISVGISMADSGEKIKELVRNAEVRMFIDKRVYYENHDRRMR